MSSDYAIFLPNVFTVNNAKTNKHLSKRGLYSRLLDFLPTSKNANFEQDKKLTIPSRQNV